MPTLLSVVRFSKFEILNRSTQKVTNNQAVTTHQSCGCVNNLVCSKTTGFKTTGFKTTGFKTTGFKTTGSKTNGSKTTGTKTRPNL